LLPEGADLLVMLIPRLTIMEGDLATDTDSCEDEDEKEEE